MAQEGQWKALEEAEASRMAEAATTSPPMAAIRMRIYDWGAGQSEVELEIPPDGELARTLATEPGAYGRLSGHMQREFKAALDALGGS
jgi:hypothetical protein